MPKYYRKHFIALTLCCAALACQSCASQGVVKNLSCGLDRIRNYTKQYNAFRDYAATNKFVYHTLGNPTEINESNLGKTEVWCYCDNKVFVVLSNYPKF